jgi:hypothetical protein
MEWFINYGTGSGMERNGMVYKLWDQT